MANNNINFSIPAGADPMGVGGFDLGRSSYDPIQSIKEAWATERQDRIMADETRRKEYEQYMKNLPPAYESVNGKISGELNQKVVDMGKLAYQRYKSGMFSPWARTESGAKTESELSQMENYVAKVGPVANKLDAMYKDAETVLKNPDNWKKINMPETQKRMKAFADAPNIEALVDIATTPLIAQRRTPVDVNESMYKSMAVSMPEEDIMAIKPKYDPITDKFIASEKKFTDPIKAASGVRKAYRQQPQDIKDEFDIMFKEAPEDQKWEFLKDEKGKNFKDENGEYARHKISVEDWVVKNYVPEYAQQITDKYINPNDDKKGSFSWGSGSRNEDGTIDFSKIENANYPMSVKKDGNVSATENFPSVASIKIAPAFKGELLNYNTKNAISTKTGEKAIQNVLADLTPVSVEVMPVANQTIYLSKDRKNTKLPFTHDDGKARKINKGDRLSQEDVEQIKANDAYRADPNKVGHPGYIVSYAPFVIAKADYSTSRGQTSQIFGTDGKPIPKVAEDIIIPFDEAKETMRKNAQANKVDFAELENYVSDILKHYNGTPLPDTNVDVDYLFKKNFVNP